MKEKDTTKEMKMKNLKLSTDKDDASMTLITAPVPAQILDKRRNSRAESTLNNIQDRQYNDQKESHEQKLKDENRNDSISTSKPTTTETKRKHWRSPSNPIEFGINCTHVSTQFNNIRLSDSNSLSKSSKNKNNNNSNNNNNNNMNTCHFIKENNTNVQIRIK